MTKSVRQSAKLLTDLARLDVSADVSAIRGLAANERGLVEPDGDALFMLSGGAQEPIERDSEPRIGGVERQSSLGTVRHRRVDVAVLLRSRRQYAKLVGDGRRLRDEAKARSSSARRLPDLGLLRRASARARREHPPIHARFRRGPRGGPVQKRAGALWIA